ALVVAVFLLPKVMTGVGPMLAMGGIWWLAFSMPAFVLLPRIAPAVPAEAGVASVIAGGDSPSTGLTSDQEGAPGKPARTASFAQSVLLDPFRRVGSTLKHLRQFRMLFLFLLAFLLYTNGTETIIYLSPAFGTRVLGMAE